MAAVAGMVFGVFGGFFAERNHPGSDWRESKRAVAAKSPFLYDVIRVVDYEKKSFSIGSVNQPEMATSRATLSYQRVHTHISLYVYIYIYIHMYIIIYI